MAKVATRQADAGLTKPAPAALNRSRVFPMLPGSDASFLDAVQPDETAADDGANDCSSRQQTRRIITMMGRPFSHFRNAARADHLCAVAAKSKGYSPSCWKPA